MTSTPVDLSALSVQEQRKYAAAKAALDYLPAGSILGVGTGSTVNYLIDMLPALQLEGAVASSAATEARLKALGIPVVELNHVGSIDVYVDGADEIDHNLLMVKGGGAALTREKIVASVAKKFVCIVDESKCVAQLARQFPLPVEVIPMARSAVARKIVTLGGDPVWRQGVVTDNGNVILDVYNLNILNAVEMEVALNNIPGVVCNGLFALRGADVAVIATAAGIQVTHRA